MHIIKISLILGVILITSCSRPDTEIFNDIISRTDKVQLRSNNMRSICFARYLDDSEISFLKDTIDNSFQVIENASVIPTHNLMLYENDSLLGFVFIDSAFGNRIRYACSEFEVIIELDFDLGGYLDNITNIKNIDCEDSYKRVLLDTISVRDFIQILKINKPVPDKVHFISVWGNVDTNWISKEDISYMIPLMDLTNPAYCVGSPVSSQSHDRTNDYSTIGGQIMNLIDFYRLKKIAPVYHPACFKNDTNRKKEILDWWNNQQ